MSETTTRKRTTKKPPQDPLDTFAEAANADPRFAIGAMLWQSRFTNPEMTVTVTQAELDKYAKSVAYLEVQPEVRIYRPQGTPARDAVPAVGNRRGIPAHPGSPAKPYVVIQLVDQDGNAFRAIESDVDDAKRRDEAAERRRLKDQAPVIAQQLLAELQQGSFTDGTMRAAANTLTALAKALP